jgi:hypothetical protein
MQSMMMKIELTVQQNSEISDKMESKKNIT